MRPDFLGSDVAPGQNISATNSGNLLHGNPGVASEQISYSAAEFRRPSPSEPLEMVNKSQKQHQFHPKILKLGENVKNSRFPQRFR